MYPQYREANLFVESFWNRSFPRPPLSLHAEKNRVVQVKYTNFIIPFRNDGKVNFNDFWSRKKAYVNQRRLSVKSDFFWIRSSAKRAFGGCLGSKRRWRTWYSAISWGEPRIGFDPQISEWGNPPDSHLLLTSVINRRLNQVLLTWIHRVIRANPGNWNI